MLFLFFNDFIKFISIKKQNKCILNQIKLKIKVVRQHLGLNHLSIQKETP